MAARSTLPGFEALGDSRGAFQIPQDAIEAGIAPNVYEDATTTDQDPNEMQNAREVLR